MELVRYKYVPGPCRVCGAAPRFKGTWVACSDPLCHLRHYRQTRVTWPRKRVIDFKATFLEIGKLSAEGCLLLAAIVSVCAVLLMLGGCTSGDGAPVDVSAKSQSTVPLSVPAAEFCTLERIYCLTRYKAGMFCFPPTELAAFRACNRLAGGAQ